jgi:hypothetical protein
LDFSKDVLRNPAPNTYSITSDFKKQTTKGFGFGKGREVQLCQFKIIGDGNNWNDGKYIKEGTWPRFLPVGKHAKQNCLQF